MNQELETIESKQKRAVIPPPKVAPAPPLEDDDEDDERTSVAMKVIIAFAMLSAVVLGAPRTENVRRISPSWSLPDRSFARTTYCPGGSTRMSAYACARYDPVRPPGDTDASACTSAGPSAFAALGACGANPGAAATAPDAGPPPP